MLTEFGRALIQAISSSSDATGSVRRIRDEGFSIYLVMDGRRRGERSAQRLELATRRAGDGDPRAEPRAGNTSNGGRGESETEPVFRINSQDVTFLKSLGIDPTRSVRSRSRSLRQGRSPS